MQSYLQFRRFGRSVEEEHERNKRNVQRSVGRNRPEAARTSTSSDSSLDSTSAASVRLSREAIETPDLEKGDICPAESAKEEEIQDVRGERLPRGVYVADRHEMAQKDDMADLHTTTTTDITPQRTRTQTQAIQQLQIPSQTLSRTATARTQHSTNTALGHSLTGVNVRGRTTHEGQKGGLVFVVGYQGEDDPSNPHNWGVAVRILSTLLIASIGFIVGFASAIDSSALAEAAKDFGVSEVAESLATGMFFVSISYSVSAQLKTDNGTNRIVPHRLWRRGPLRRSLQRNGWAKSSVYCHADAVYALHHGIGARAKPRLPTRLPLLGWLLRKHAARVRRRLAVRSVEPHGTRLCLSRIRKRRFHRSVARARHGWVHGQFQIAGDVAMDRVDHTHHLRVGVDDGGAVPAGDVSADASALASSPPPTRDWR
jgi:hypothetical protein